VRHSRSIFDPPAGLSPSNDPDTMAVPGVAECDLLPSPSYRGHFCERTSYPTPGVLTQETMQPRKATPPVTLRKCSGENLGREGDGCAALVQKTQLCARLSNPAEARWVLRTHTASRPTLQGAFRLRKPKRRCRQRIATRLTEFDGAWASKVSPPPESRALVDFGVRTNRRREGAD
jgi:hypothetical protein